MTALTIRKSTLDDIPALCVLADAARAFMAAHGNAAQWGDGYPRDTDFAADIQSGSSYVCVDQAGQVVGTFACFDYEPCYDVIYDGAWLNTDPYVALHRVASFSGQGIGTFMLRHMMSKARNIKIDTMASNYPMRALLTKLGFKYCGIIEIKGRGQRVAYQWCANA